MELWQGLQPGPASGVTEERAGEFELKQYVCEGLQGGRRSVGANDGSSGMPDARSVKLCADGNHRSRFSVFCIVSYVAHTGDSEALTF